VGVLSLSVQREEFPYEYFTVEGTVAQTDQPLSDEQLLVVARRHLPEEAALGFVQAEFEYP
jgi:uncharacterized protein